jgi:hypothetical protein
MVDFHIDTRRFEFTGTDTGKSRLSLRLGIPCDD